MRQVGKRNEIERDGEREDRETYREEEEGVIKKYWVRGSGGGGRAGSQLLVGEESAWGM
jgi:hypothetical protein